LFTIFFLFVFTSFFQQRNRACDGDTVIVVLNPKSRWKILKVGNVAIVTFVSVTETLFSLFVYSMVPLMMTCWLLTHLLQLTRFLKCQNQIWSSMNWYGDVFVFFLPIPLTFSCYYF
jgi:hypothetical protein